MPTMPTYQASQGDRAKLSSGHCAFAALDLEDGMKGEIDDDDDGAPDGGKAET